ncbi:unnamed protein product [Thelazia callipaeda]|uniref:39S ribosomal protein L22, mitochondrial n=1 Tax=Thelazia callipaeda TaxID=103827 RepID=A0A0N5CSS7_THECL|nr:unnamed protein product [Thelazia callipaeda]
MGFTSKSRVFDALFRCSNAKLCHYRYKSSYSRDKILRLEEEKKTVEKEISSKYLFRPRLPVLIEHDCFDAPFQYEYDKICRENYAWDSEFSAIKTVWERLKPPPQDEVEENVLLIGNPQTLPWAPNEWCVERAFDCYRNKRDVARIHLTIKYLEMLQKLPTLPFGFMLDIKRHIQQKVLIERTRKLFELVCQTYYTGTLQKLSVSDENAEPIVKRMCEVEQFETSRREMLNITEQDIITVAPGLYG